MLVSSCLETPERFIISREGICISMVGLKDVHAKMFEH